MLLRLLKHLNVCLIRINFFETAAQYIEPGGLLLFSTASCSGFEYLVLGEHAPNINPINRMNLLSMKALENKVQQAGFEIIELSTPGRLDVEIVSKALEHNPQIHLDGFWGHFFTRRDDKSRQRLQKFLQENLLSSHVRIAARKK